MASGRVGGTKSLKSGKIGDTVLGIVQEPSGSYAQKVSAYVPKKAQTKTIKLACQQQCTAMVEAMMRDLKPLAKVSFQSAANKSKSLNAFSSFNLNKVLNEMKNHWYKYHEFMFPEKGNHLKMGGTWILSSGTLGYDCFDGWFGDIGDNPKIDPLVKSTFDFFGVFFEFPKTEMTIGEFMDKRKLQYNTEMWMAIFWLSDSVDPWPKPDPSYRIGKYVWKRITLNPKVRRDEIVTEQTIEDLFVTESSLGNLNRWSRPNEYSPWRKHAYCMGIQYNDPDLYYHPLWMGAFTINYELGRKKVSSSSMEFIESNTTLEISTELTPEYSVSSWTDPKIPWPVPYPW